MANADKPLSPWEWLPVVAMLLLAAGFFLAEPGGASRNFCLFVGLGLLPGSIRRLCGKSSWTVHRIGFAAGLVAFVLDNPGLWPGRAVVDKIAEQWPMVLLGLAISATQPIWGTLRLNRLFADSGLAADFGKTLRLCLAGSFFNIFLPGATGGDVYRVYAVTGGEKRNLAPAIASITLDRFLGLPPLMLLILLAALFDREFAFGHKALSGLMTFVAVGALVSLAAMLALWLGRNKEDNPEKPPGRFGRIHRLLAVNLSRPATLPATLAYGLVSHIMVVLSCILFGRVVGVEGIPALRYFLLVPLAMSINAIPGAPGGIGQGEIAMAALFDLAAPGLGNAQAGVAVMLLSRLSNILIGLPGGFVYATGGIRLDQAESRLEELEREADGCP